MKRAMTQPSVKKTKGTRMHNTLVYMRQHWQLYLIFMLPAVVLTIVFRYLPMGGILIAFTEYNPIRGILGSEWVGFDHFTRFLSSPDFMQYLLNTLKLSVFGLLWGFPAPILLAFLLNRIMSSGIKQKIQLILYMPNFISVRYCPDPAFSHRHAESASGNILQFHDHARGLPYDLHCQRHLAGSRLGFHYLHGGTVQCQQGPEGSCRSGWRKYHPADQSRGMACNQRHRSDSVHYERG